MSDPHKEIERLKATIEILEQENSQLSERAEDAMLQGLVAEAIQGIKGPVEVMEQVLERVSILKDFPYVTCGGLVDGKVERICSYSSFSDNDNLGYPLSLDEEVCRELDSGPFVSHSFGGIKTSLAGSGFSASSVTLIPFNCFEYGSGVFLFFGREENRAQAGSRLFLLDQIVNMTVGYLDNLFLTKELDTLNVNLEKRVREKTAALVAANEQLHEAHTRFTTVLDGIDAYIYVVNMESYEILYLNRKSRQTFPIAQEGKLCYKSLRNENFPCQNCKIPYLTGSHVNPDHVTVWEHHEPETGLWLLNREKTVSWPNVSQAKLTIATDISDIKKAEEERRTMQKSLQQAQKMEAVGVLAGSVAHDLNNILSGVVSYPDLLLANLADDSELRKPLESIQASGRKAAAIVSDLLALARRGLEVNETVDLLHLIKDYLTSVECATLLKHHSRVKIIAPEGRGHFPVTGSSAHLSNVIMNIVTNASEAMPDGGTITISLDIVSLTSSEENWPAWRSGDYVKLSIADTGTGIPESIQQRIFDPFFSGKMMERSGTGLGLAIVWGTIADHDGTVTVESEEGKGTTFHIFLPLQGQKTENVRINPSHGLVRGNGQTVLVVDDVEIQRQIALEILEHLNYSAISVESGEKAIHHLQKSKVDLVMLDMIMPNGIDGLETYKSILAFRPEQKVIIVSGYSQTEKILEVRQLGIKQYVSKPYTLLKLSEAIHLALES